MIDLAYLNTLHTIVQAGSFMKAARQLNKAQSAVSYDVKQLEQQLGVTLFDRSGHRARLTAEGEAILDEGRQLLARARRISRLARQFQAGWEPHLRIVIDGILPVQPIMEVLAELAEEGIPTKVQIKVEFLGGVQHRFEKERADLMMVKDFRPNDLLVAQALPKIECVLVCGLSHPLHHTESIALPDLQEHVELAVHDSSGIETDQNLFGGARVYFLSDFYTKKQALLMGMGFGWMPMHLIDDALTSGTLWEIPYENGSRFSFRPLLVHPIFQPLGQTGDRFLRRYQEKVERPH